MRLEKRALFAHPVQAHGTTTANKSICSNPPLSPTAGNTMLVPRIFPPCSRIRYPYHQSNSVFSHGYGSHDCPVPRVRWVTLRPRGRQTRGRMDRGRMDRRNGWERRKPLVLFPLFPSIKGHVPPVSYVNPPNRRKGHIIYRTLWYPAKTPAWVKTTPFSRCSPATSGIFEISTGSSTKSGNSSA